MLYIRHTWPDVNFPFLVCMFNDNIDIYEKTPRDSASCGDPAGGFGKFHDFNPTILNTDIYIFQYVFAP